MKLNFFIVFFNLCCLTAGAVLMSASTVIVALNAQLLRRERL